MLNESGARRRSFGSHVPVRDGLLLRDATGGERATALVAGHELPARCDGDALVVGPPVLGLFEVVHICCR
ncbi:hypothetical protein [Amycolatopsis sp.]|uniref:hypothetical protein n=1 Tax=Amycolatopsis sp. TaxID=37632 RepID=UPI002D80EE29|nr:hypothetical protein [Amycolatopsis sp.]HET6703995.1 hypothetical protein [Amycolatopsis sp.]